MNVYTGTLVVIALGLVIFLVWRRIAGDGKRKMTSVFTYENIDGTTHIHVPKGSSDRDVLQAIVKASFHLARAAGLGRLHFDENQGMTDEDAAQFVNLSESRDNYVVGMDYIQGRQCKTYIFQEAPGHYTLDNGIFERDRGSLEPMLEFAKQLLAGNLPVGMADTSYVYIGENLDKRLAEWGFTRINGETDWAFRKRVFPDLHEKDSGCAYEFLLGKSVAEWHEVEKVLVLGLGLESKGSPSRSELIKFAEGFASDPLEMWQAQPSL